jgi:hypothetical protein
MYLVHISCRQSVYCRHFPEKLTDNNKIRDKKAIGLQLAEWLLTVFKVLQS